MNEAVVETALHGDGLADRHEIAAFARPARLDQRPGGPVIHHELVAEDLDNLAFERHRPAGAEVGDRRSSEAGVEGRGFGPEQPGASSAPAMPRASSAAPRPPAIAARDRGRRAPHRAPSRALASGTGDPAVVSSCRLVISSAIASVLLWLRPARAARR